MLMVLASLFVAPGDHSLQERSKEVAKEEVVLVQETIDEMLKIASGERGDVEKRVMVGLAAPQIGIGKRIILVDIGVDKDRKDLGKLVAYINPEIVWQSEEIVFGREGCYSVAKQLCGYVPR